MKLKIWIMMLVTVLLIGGITIGLTNSQVEAKKKSKVTFHLSKKGTLTIKGKGKMPAKVAKIKRKKIKKVVIKKGVTSVCKYAFCGCKKLKTVKMPNTIKTINDGAFANTPIKKVTIPKSVKTICGESFMNCCKLQKVTMPGSFKFDGLADEGRDDIFNQDSIKTIKLSTNLNVECACYMRAENIIVLNKDKHFKSIDGVVYSKDGKDIVRVPYLKKKVNIAEGCKNLYVEAFMYGMSVWDDYDMCYSHIEELVIPESVTKVSDNKYGDCGVCENPHLKKLTIKTQSLDETSVLDLLKSFTIYGTYNLETTLSFSVKAGDVLNQLKAYRNINGMYVSLSNKLVVYEGKDKVATIPDGVVEIESEAFARSYFDPDKTENLEKIIMPDSVEIVGDRAFNNREKLKEIVWSKSLKRLGMYLLFSTNITTLTLPESVPIISDSAFAFSGVKTLVIPEGYTTLPSNCFWACKDLKSITFPSTFKTLKKSTFDCIDGLDIKSIIKGTGIVLVDD